MNKARLSLLGFGLPVIAAILYFVLVPVMHRGTLPVSGFASHATVSRHLQANQKLPLVFEVNQGQTDERVDFLSRGNGYTLLLTPSEAEFSFALTKAHDRGDQRTSLSASGTIHNTSATALHMKLAGANSHAVRTDMERLPGKANYLLGSDSSKWRTNIDTYGRVGYKNVYQGVDVLYYGTDNELEYDFVVAPGADATAIKLKFEGPDKVDLDAQGDLLLHLATGSVLQFHKPFIYQEKDGIQKQVAGNFVLDDDQVGFHLGAYDRGRPVIIDPIFSYSTHLGGAHSSSGQGIAVDQSGNVYVTGDTNSIDFPTTKALQHEHGGSTDIFITKLSPDGSKILYSTYIGGSGDDIGYGVAVDSSGNAYITGDTSSANFPLEKPLQKTLGGIFDAFALKLSSDGSKLLYSTFLGGGQGDRGGAIAVDFSGNAYITGFTYSTDFPLLNPIQTAFTDGNVHAFVTKLSTVGALVYSTYLGGGDDRPDQATGVAVDSDGNAYVTGYTNSAKFPSVNSVQKFVGPTDVFVTKINPAGSAFVYSTHIGGNADDEGMAIAVDASGSAYVTGETESLGFPTTPGAYSTKCTGVATPGRMRELCSGGDVFVSKLSPDGSKLVYSTFVNGKGFEVGRGIAVDKAGNAYVTGLTTSQDFPLVNPLQKGFGGAEFDAFVFKLSADGSTLVYSTLLGGNQNDGGYGIATDAQGSAYVIGYTYSTDFPTKNPLRKGSGTANPGFRDVFVTKITDAGGFR